MLGNDTRKSSYKNLNCKRRWLFTIPTINPSRPFHQPINGPCRLTRRSWKKPQARLTVKKLILQVKRKSTTVMMSKRPRCHCFSVGSRSKECLSKWARQTAQIRKLGIRKMHSGALTQSSSTKATKVRKMETKKNSWAGKRINNWKSSLVFLWMFSLMDKRHFKQMKMAFRPKICDKAETSQSSECTVQSIQPITPGSKQNIKNTPLTKGTLKRILCWTITRKTSISSRRTMQRRSR